VQVEIQLRELT